MQCPRHVMSHADRAGVAPHQGPHRPSQRGQRPQADESVHRGGTVSQIRPCRSMEAGTAPEHDRKGEREREPLPAVELQGGNHRQQHHRHRKDDGNDQFVADFRRVILGRCCRLRHGSAVSSCLDHLDEVVDADRPGRQDVGLASGVVDGGLNPVNLVELLRDPGGAGSATHPGDVEVDGGGLRLLVRFRRGSRVGEGGHVLPSWTTRRSPGRRGQAGSSDRSSGFGGRRAVGGRSASGVGT